MYCRMQPASYRVKAMIEALETGGTPEKFSYVDEGIFSADQTVDVLNIDGTDYEVTILTEESMSGDDKNR